jgi:uncharacterized membrane protein YqiK
VLQKQQWMETLVKINTKLKHVSSKSLASQALDETKILNEKLVKLAVQFDQEITEIKSAKRVTLKDVDKRLAEHKRSVMESGLTELSKELSQELKSTMANVKSDLISKVQETKVELQDKIRETQKKSV